jgi:hypothetical protein
MRIPTRCVAASSGRTRGDERHAKSCFEAAKESNLPTLALPGPAGFEECGLQGVCACLGAFLFG